MSSSDDSRDKTRHVLVRATTTEDRILYEKPVGVFEDVEVAREKANELIDDGYGAYVEETPVGMVSDE